MTEQYKEDLVLSQVETAFDDAIMELSDPATKNLNEIDAEAAATGEIGTELVSDMANNIPDFATRVANNQRLSQAYQHMCDSMLHVAYRAAVDMDFLEEFANVQRAPEIRHGIVNRTFEAVFNAMNEHGNGLGDNIAKLAMDRLRFFTGDKPTIEDGPINPLELSRQEQVLVAGFSTTTLGKTDKNYISLADMSWLADQVRKEVGQALLRQSVATGIATIQKNNAEAALAAA